MSGAEAADPSEWCGRSFLEQRQLLAEALSEELGSLSGVREIRIEPGPVGREYDLTAVVQTDVGALRAPLWSHARAMIYCDPSIHAANREQLSPIDAVSTTAAWLKPRLEAACVLESRGLTVTLNPEPGVQRTWTAEHSLFRKRTSVTREDRVEQPGELDVRDLLAHFYTGPSLRVVCEDGEAFLLPGAAEAEGPLVSLCGACRRWSEGGAAECADCGGPADIVVAARPPRR